MVISSEFRMAQYRDDDREEHSTLPKENSPDQQEVQKLMLEKIQLDMLQIFLLYGSMWHSCPRDHIQNREQYNLDRHD